MCRLVSFRTSDRLHLPQGTHLTLNCGGGAVDLLSRTGPPHLGMHSTLTLQECRISGVRRDGGRGGSSNAADALVLWPAQHAAAVVAVDSFLHEPCAVRSAECAVRRVRRAHVVGDVWGRQGHAVRSGSGFVEP